MKGARGSAGRESGRTKLRHAMPISSGAAPKHRVPLAVAGAAVNAKQPRTSLLHAQPRWLITPHPDAGPDATA